jgi:hypothetical protein
MQAVSADISTVLSAASLGPSSLTEPMFQLYQTCQYPLQSLTTVRQEQTSPPGWEAEVPAGVAVAVVPWQQAQLLSLLILSGGR